MGVIDVLEVRDSESGVGNLIFLNSEGGTEILRYGRVVIEGGSEVGTVGQNGEEISSKSWTLKDPRDAFLKVGGI